MSTTLYRPGGLHNVRGVLCELRNFDNPEHYLTGGWFYSPEECYPDTKEPEENIEESTSLKRGSTHGRRSKS